MKILAIDSSGLVASAAVLEDDILAAEYTINHKKTHSQTLLPMIDEITRMIELDLKDLDAIAVAGGPGSFTGLRIGSATAKGLGLALDLPLISVPTVDALAYNFCGMDGIICPMMDARRSQVYTGIYRIRGHEMEVLLPQDALPVEEIAAKLNELYRTQCTQEKEAASGCLPFILLGDGVPVYLERLSKLLEMPFRTAPPHLSRQRAGALAVLAAQYLHEGKTQTAEEHGPDYLRLSQAERERAEKEKAEKERAEKEKEEREQAEKTKTDREQQRVVIRPMQAEDLDEVAALETKNFSVPWKKEDFARYLNDEKAVFLTAVLAENRPEAEFGASKGGSPSEDAAPASGPADRIAGYIGCLFAADEGDITNVSVNPGIRRAGAGRALVRELIRRAEERGCRRIFLEVRASNEAAIRLYRSEGFVETGVRKNYYSAPKEDALLMAREASDH